MIQTKHIGLLVLLFSIVFSSCDDDTIPKPMGYFRITLPEKSYSKTDIDCPFEFEIPSVSKMSLPSKNQSCFYNWEYPKFKATIHTSYLKLDTNLSILINEEFKRKSKHNRLASSVDEIVINEKKNNVSGIVFHINGTKTATPLQFYLTDSVNHFYRGSLYFYHSPNNDSIAPIIDYIKEDVNHMIETFEWK